MDDSFHERIQMQVLNFATDKRSQWERNHHLYSVIFELTPRCNFNCVHCYLHDHHVSNELRYFLKKNIAVIDLHLATIHRRFFIESAVKKAKCQLSSFFPIFHHMVNCIVSYYTLEEIDIRGRKITAYKVDTILEPGIFIGDNKGCV